MKKGFTLVELLVVISIISVLASIILVSLQSARKKAIIAAAIEFETHNYRLLGASAFGMWNFDENPVTKDSSANNNNLTLNGAPNPVTVPGLSGSALQFNGSNYAVSSKPISLGSSWTMSVWVYPTSNLDPSGNGMIPLTFGLPYIGWNTGRFWWSALAPDCTTQSTPGVGGSTGRSLNQWYQVTLTRDGTANTTKFYVNGQLDETVSTTPLCSNMGNNVWIGQQGASYFTFIGSVDAVRIYPQALSDAEINNMYAEGASSHGIVLK